ncbi:cell division FtsZ family protein [bacterium]|nr:cell division FtsZ family protein [bacterium]
MPKFKKSEKKESDNRKTPFKLRKVKVEVVGIGGGGSSIVTEIAKGLKGARFALIDCDKHILKKAGNNVRAVLLGEKITKGLGTGMDRDLGARIVENSKDKVNQIFKGNDILILISSLGGGFGSGATPLLADLARKTGSITLGIFTLPFSFEGEKKSQLAKGSLQKIEEYLSGKLVVPNDKIFEFGSKKTPFKKALSLLNEKIIDLLKSLMEVISKPGVINLDFSDLKTIFKGSGKLVYFKTIEAQGPNRAEEVIKKIFQPSLHLQPPSRTFQRVLLNIAGGKDLSLKEVELLGKKVCSLNPRVKMILGISENQKYNGKLKVTFIGVGDNREGVKKNTKDKQKTVGEKRRRSNKKKKKALQKKDNTKWLKKPMLESGKKKANFHLRRNALEIRKEEKAAEEKQLLEEKDWEIPAFLRKKIK